MIFKKGDKVTTPHGDGTVQSDQTANEVKVLLSASNTIEVFTEEDIDYDLSPREV